MKQLSTAAPYCLIVTGLPGSGKTEFARSFADSFGSPFVEAGLIQSYSIDDQAGDAATDYMLRELLKVGRTIVVEPAIGSKTERVEVAKKARAAGFQPLVVWVQVDPNVARHRSTTSTRTRKAYHDDETFERAARKFTAPSDNEQAVVISGMHTHASQLRTVLKRITQTSGRDRLPITTGDRETQRASRATGTRLVQ